MGRISAQYDDNFNAYHDNRWGMFGFLELEDAPDILEPMLEAASIWLRAHGRDRMVGPMDFTMNDECGVLIDGFERMPFLKPALASAVLRASAARRPGWPRPSTCSCTSW